MWRISSLLFVLLLVLSSAQALVTVYAPVAAQVATGDTFAVGSVEPGQDVTLIIDRGPKSDPWTSVEANPDVLQGFETGEDRAWITIRFPPGEKGTKTVCFTLRGNAAKDRFCAAFLVVPDTLDVTAGSNVVEAEAGRTVKMPVVVANRGVGRTRVVATCASPYCGRAEAILDPGAVDVLEVPYESPVPGDHNVAVRVADEASGAEHRVNVVIRLKPNFRNDFRAALFGIPAMDFVLLPVRFILGYVP